MTLGQKVVSAVGWSAGTKIGFQLVTWALTLVVIRILTPDDYGLMAIAQVFMNVLAGFSNLGLADALVQQRDTPKAVVASVFGVMILLSATLTVALSLAAYPIAAWYHDPRLVLLIQVASAGFLLNGLMTLPRVFLTKSLRVRPMFIIELSSSLAGAVTVIALAYTGHGVWSLMLGVLVGNVVRLAAFAAVTSEYYVWPSLTLKHAWPLLSYGSYRTLSYLAWIAFTSADTLIVGKLLGPVELGFYTVALNFAVMPLNKIAPIINSVAFPAFAMVQAQPAEARFYALKAMRLISVVSVPVFFGISALAPEIVDMVFGPQWADAKPVLAVLSLAMTVRASLLVNSNFLQGIGQARAGFLCTATGTVLFPPAFLIGCHWGVPGVCYAWLLVYPVMFAINALIVARCGQLDVRTLLATPLRPLAAGAVMLGAVTLLRAWLPPDGAVLPRIAILMSGGAATYAAVMLLAFRPLALEIMSVFYRRRPHAA